MSWQHLGVKAAGDFLGTATAIAAVVGHGNGLWTSLLPWLFDV